MKTCSQCKEVKGLEAFSRNRAMKDGLDFYCKLCRSEAQRESYRRNRKRRRQSSREWNQRNPGYREQWLQRNRGYYRSEVKS